MTAIVLAIINIILIVLIMIKIKIMTSIKDKFTKVKNV